jgi:hypothetical protein
LWTQKFGVRTIRKEAQLGAGQAALFKVVDETVRHG